MNTNYITSNDIFRCMNNWDKQVADEIKKGHTRNEAIVIVAAVMVNFFYNYSY